MTGKCIGQMCTTWTLMESPLLRVNGTRAIISRAAVLRSQTSQWRAVCTTPPTYTEPWCVTGTYIHTCVFVVRDAPPSDGHNATVVREAQLNCVVSRPGANLENGPVPGAIAHATPPFRSSLAPQWVTRVAKGTGRIVNNVARGGWSAVSRDPPCTHTQRCCAQAGRVHVHPSHNHRWSRPSGCATNHKVV